MLCKAFSASFVLSILSSVLAAPADGELLRRQSITALTTAQISAFKPFSFFASSAYCNPSTTIKWTCGANCNANPDFIPVASGGDGSSVQFWYVGYSPSQATVIVAHQGTDTSKIEADATDVDAFLESLDSTLFPGISSSVEAHSGFANEQAKTATTILSAVKTAISAHSAKKVTIVGHSLGAAIALLDGVYLPLHISGVSFRVIGYGMPRVGNQAFADYVDAHLSLTHINNKEDIVPIVPGESASSQSQLTRQNPTGRFLGYHHPSGEVHIMDNNQWVSCPGQDNTSTECTVGDVPNIFEGTPNDHHGPYDGGFLLLLTSLSLPAAMAAPASTQPELSLTKRQSITALSAAQISAFKPFTFFASTAYCSPSTTITWSCGGEGVPRDSSQGKPLTCSWAWATTANCAANSDFIPTASGGDGDGTQFWYVGFSPSQRTVIVAHQGTDTSEFLADLTDVDFFLGPLDPTLFPGISSSIEVHSGFRDEQASTAPTILAAVQKTIAAHAAKKVTVTGHSLGAALALLDGVYLPLHISGVAFEVIGYGTPRVGNQDFANYVDAHLSFTHINNKEDPVPILPGRFLGFHHPSGEVHIMDNNQWVSCPGQDNTSSECTVGDVPNIFESDESDHDGPYDGVEMGC
ncbi:LOW QUALITY PROTEIN: hypothetical protein CVT26_012749 [Gymnopilus dilepis]|uniref:Fungal lipase-type domain-containing protein n=1 Tax=Gymnopilus dilepis TaxID=231916 RepID=A0A409WDR6_9AGAR|nr:LOW QUALITY PROTEIN: hypothetical protein CVT26_012749 [Gymnopilus dilepis]